MHNLSAEEPGESIGDTMLAVLEPREETRSGLISWFSTGGAVRRGRRFEVSLPVDLRRQK